jgi:hypothetical protein
MRVGVFLLILLCVPVLAAQDGADPNAKRYGYEADETKYSQKTPDVALKSVIQAMDDRRMDYLMAQLADPVFVDKRVAEYQTRFEGPKSARALLAFDLLVKETGRYFRDDPALVRELRRFAKEAEWKADENAAAGSVKELPGRQVFMRKVHGRWFLENKQQQ